MKKSYFLSKRGMVRALQAIVLCGIMVISTAQACSCPFCKSVHHDGWCPPVGPCTPGYDTCEYDTSCCPSIFKCCGNFQGQTCIEDTCTPCGGFYPLCGSLPSVTDVESTVVTTFIVPFVTSTKMISDIAAFLKTWAKGIIDQFVTDLCKTSGFSGICSAADFLADAKVMLNSLLKTALKISGLDGSGGVGGMIQKMLNQNVKSVSAGTLMASSVVFKNWIDQSVPGAQADVISDVASYLWNMEGGISTWVSDNITPAKLAAYVNLGALEKAIQDSFETEVQKAIAAVTDPITSFINLIRYMFTQVMCSIMRFVGANGGGDDAAKKYYRIEGYAPVKCNFTGTDPEDGGIGKPLIVFATQGISRTVSAAHADGGSFPAVSSMMQFAANLPKMFDINNLNAGDMAARARACMASVGGVAKKVLLMPSQTAQSAAQSNRDLAAAILNQKNIGFDAIQAMSHGDFSKMNLCDRANMPNSLLSALQFSANYTGIADQEDFLMPKSAEGTVEGLNYLTKINHFMALASGLEFAISAEILVRTMDSGESSITDMMAVATDLVAGQLAEMGVADGITSFIAGIADLLSYPGQMRMQTAQFLADIGRMVSSEIPAMANAMVGMFRSMTEATLTADMKSMFDPIQSEMKTMGAS